MSVVVFLAAAASMPGPARADQQQQARVLFQRAEVSFHEGRFGEALRDYQAAYEQKPLPGFLFNIGQCYRMVGLYEPARSYFRRFIALNPPPAQRKLAQDVIDDLDLLQSQQRHISGMAGGASTIMVSDRTAGGLDLLMMPSPERVSVESRPFYRRWWFWTLVGGAIAGGAVVAAVAAGGHGGPQGSLPPINAGMGNAGMSNTSSLRP
ncbi:MAG TPA: tetratricopeptide repeat protein [Polyangia bacterium]|nr:tetratricopeptide repeat protein [Polyangia bacterium]